MGIRTLKKKVGKHKAIFDYRRLQNDRIDRLEAEVRQLSEEVRRWKLLWMDTIKKEQEKGCDIEENI